METSWRVESRTDNLVELQRDGEILEIERPIDQGTRFIFRVYGLVRLYTTI